MFLHRPRLGVDAGKLALAFLVFSLVPVHAHDGVFSANQAAGQPANISTSKPDPGSTFHKGAINIGISAGAGVSGAVLGSTQRHDLALGYLRFGYVLTDRLAADKWYQGHLELGAEAFGGRQYHPESRYVAGLMLGLRYDVITRGRLVPFIEGGAGPSLTDIGEPDLSTTFQFNTQLGLGSHFFIRDTLSLTLQMRGIHLSNAYIDTPNHGANALLFLGGLCWFF